MKRKLFSITLCAGLAATALGFQGVAYAEYPERPITMIVAYDAGGGTDIAARTMVPYIEQYLGGNATITVVNRPGAGGAVGFSELSRSKPDGYTIGFINTPNIMTAVIQDRAQYTMDDFSPIANIVSDPGAFSVLTSSDIKSLDDLVDYAKKNPGKVTYTSTGTGSDDHLAGLDFERITGVKMTHVPYTGNAAERTALLGGHVMLASMNISESTEDMEEGKIRVLGQMSEERWDGAPDVPTFKEQGYDLLMGSDRGIAAPSGIPEDIKKKLASAIEKTIQNPEFQEKAKKQFLPLSFQGPDDYKNMLEQQDKTLHALWDEHPWVEGK